MLLIVTSAITWAVLQLLVGSFQDLLERTIGEDISSSSITESLIIDLDLEQWVDRLLGGQTAPA